MNGSTPQKHNRWIKILISVFIAWNLFILIDTNRPQLTRFENLAPANSSLQRSLWHVRWWIRIYAHIVGLDNKWEMFSYIYRDDWQLVFRARYKGQKEEVVLPLPMQSERGFFDKWFFDFRDAKHRLNIYGTKEARESYERFLCRQFANRDGATIEYVACDLESQPILPREHALKLGTHLAGYMSQMRFEAMRCE